MRRFSLAVAFLVLPLLLHAQVRGRGPSGGGHAVITAPRSGGYAAPVSRTAGGGGIYRGVPRAPATVTTGRRSFANHPTPRTAASSNSAFGRSNALPDFTNAVPGLGFDYVHYAAVHPARGRRGTRGGYNGYFPFFDAGFLLPYAPYYGGAQYDEPQAYDSSSLQPTDVPGGDANAERRQGYAQQAVSSYDVVVEPQKPSEQYVFVRRDGSVFFAVAYTWDAGNLYYVTQEGLRRSATRDSLDLDATQQFNEQRGLNFQSPARS
jgi:hypothetical protein